MYSQVQRAAPTTDLHESMFTSTYSRFEMDRNHFQKLLTWDVPRRQFYPEQNPVLIVSRLYVLKTKGHSSSFPVPGTLDVP